MNDSADRPRRGTDMKMLADLGAGSEGKGKPYLGHRLPYTLGRGELRTLYSFESSSPHPIPSEAQP